MSKFLFLLNSSDNGRGGAGSSALGGRLKYITANGPPQLSGAIINTNKTRLHPSSRIQVLSGPSPGQRLLIFMVTKFFKERGRMASIVSCLSLISKARSPLCTAHLEDRQVGINMHTHLPRPHPLRC